MKLSIAIPAYEYHGRGVGFLEYQFKKFNIQSFKDFQIVISDHSEDDEIESFCKLNQYGLNIKYLRNKDLRGSSSANTNNAIRNCDGEIIKIIFQDDFLWNEESLNKTINAFPSDAEWLVSGCIHTFDDCVTFRGPKIPYYNEGIYLGNNTISSPSVLSIRNSEGKLFFDERLIWLMDVDYYKSMYDKFGLPVVLGEITVVNRDCNDRLSKTISDNVKIDEAFIVKQKYEG